MNINKKISVLSTGCYLPKPISSLEIENQYNLASGWSEKYSGVKIDTMSHLSLMHMGAKAIEFAIGNSNLELSDIDLIISAGATYDYPLPNQSK